MIIKHNQKTEVINIRQMNIYQPKIFFGNGKRSVFDFFFRNSIFIMFLVNVLSSVNVKKQLNYNL